MSNRYYKKCPNCGDDLYFTELSDERKCKCGRVYEINTVLIEIVPDPRIFKDGDQWCALHGENIQEGIAGYGNTPNEALEDYIQMYRGKT